MNKTIKIILIVVLILVVGIIFVNLLRRPAADGSDCNKEFALYTANLDGSNMKMLISDPYRQMTHARVSPDMEWIAFSRFNVIGKDGCAIPSPGNHPTGGEAYAETELLLMKLDGSDLRVLIPPERGQGAVNSYWTPAGGLIYMCKQARICHLTLSEDMEVEGITEIPIPDYLGAVDPHWGKDSSGNDRIVFAAFNFQTKEIAIWWIKPDGSDLENLVKSELNVNDPKISPDGKKMAYMQNIKDGLFWHSKILDLETREETDLSAGYFPDDTLVGMDAMPEWSSDGKLLIFWHIYVDKNGKTETPLHTIKPDGSGRKKVPLPEGYAYTIVAFFPDEGSDDNTRIIFSSTKTKD